MQQRKKLPAVDAPAPGRHNIRYSGLEIAQQQQEQRRQPEGLDAAVSNLSAAAVSLSLLAALTLWRAGLFVGAGFALAVTLVLAVICLAKLSALDEENIVVSQKEIRLPYSFLLSMRLRLKRKWSDVDRLYFCQGQAISNTPDNIMVTFKSGGSCQLQLAGLRESDFKQILIAMQTFVPDLKTIPDMNEEEIDIPSIATGSSIQSFTQMWENELSDRFAATLFVPMGIGDQLQNGLYTIRSQLTFGGSSAIYLAGDRSGQRVVIKEAAVQATQAGMKEKALEMFERESTLLGKLDDARIAKLIDRFVENGHHYQVLQYISGSDLRTHVSQFGPQPEEFVLRWAVELASILEYLHKQSPPVIHRDLSPDNIIERTDGSLAVIDFGAANEFIGNATGTVVGKQAYIAPEQFRGKAVPQSDIYSLGATLYFLSTGRDPLALSCSHPRHANSLLSEPFDALVARCTAIDLSERYASAQELSQSLAPLLSAR